MRNILITEGEYYHVYNRGVEKKNIFLNDLDYNRFLLTLLLLQSTQTINNLSYHTISFIKHRVFDKAVSEKIKLEVMEKKYIELISFVLMPNHFHIIIKEKKENGISKFMQRTQNSYAKYFNTKYKKSGHLFQGPYRAVHIKDNEQLLYLSAYIHRNPNVLSKFKNKSSSYKWSSYTDYLNDNRFGNLLCPQIVSGQFSNSLEYYDFVENSGAKDIEGEIEDLIID